MSDLWIVHATRHPLRGLSRWFARTRRNVGRWLRWGTRRTSKDHQRFMQSPEWRAQRLRILRRDGYRCVDCRTARAREVHHNWYASPIAATPDTALTSLCEPCHRMRHRNRRTAPTSRRLW